MALPSLPAPLTEVVDYLDANRPKPVLDLLEPYRSYEASLRTLYAQDPSNSVLQDNHVNLVPVYAGKEDRIRIRARNLGAEDAATQDHYIMPLKDANRKASGSHAIAPSLKEFQDNFNIFSELSLSSMDWSNVVCAGSAVVTSLMPLPAEHTTSRRSVRQYYHDQIAPASDVDLFLYGLTEEQALDKIRHIERAVRDSLLVETTTIRTKHAITIASQYPHRHVQVVLRIYKSISEILTGFDVDCSCAAYDGTQVWVTPRALGAYMTQINRIDLSRRSPSYENRLSKYSRRGFEAYWPLLDRTRVDPTIYERSFTRTVGLARLLVLEKIPAKTAREAYVEERRRERGRPPVSAYLRYRNTLHGNVKDWNDDEVAEWMDEEAAPSNLSNYTTFTIPYGKAWNHKKIETLFFKQDLLQNAQWNQPKNREVNLHRHPAFFGNFDDIIHDCCGSCPKPTTDEDIKVYEEESKHYVSGEVSFLRDNPGRQEIGSFNPTTDDDWTTMAYISKMQQLSEAILSGDTAFVRNWCQDESNDVNARDHTGRTALHLAVQCSTPEIVQILIDNGARLVARLADGRTSLHLAAIRGDAEIVRAILRKSEANMEEEMEKEDARKAVPRKTGNEEIQNLQEGNTDGDTDAEMVDAFTNTDAMDTDTDGFVQVTPEHSEAPTDGVSPDDNEDEPDVFDVDILSWDIPGSALHMAIASGAEDVVRELVQSFGANVLLPVKFVHEYDRSPKAALLALVIAMRLPVEKAKSMTLLLLQLGASAAQTDLHHVPALFRFSATDSECLDVLIQHGQPAANKAIKQIYHGITEWSTYLLKSETALSVAISKQCTSAALRVLKAGAAPHLTFESWIKGYKTRNRAPGSNLEADRQDFEWAQQPIISAIYREMPDAVSALIEAGIPHNTLTSTAHSYIQQKSQHNAENALSLLDLVQTRVNQLHKTIVDLETPKIFGYCPAHTPEELLDDAYYLKGLDGNSYKHWSGRMQLANARKNGETRLKKLADQQEEWEKESDLRSRKHAECSRMLTSYKTIEAKLLSMGAKTFVELYPDLKAIYEEHRNMARRSSSNNQCCGATKDKPFTIACSFKVPSLDESLQSAYESVFEAAWQGNLSTVESFTLRPWGESGSELPLRVDVQDGSDVSPFVVSVMRGHYGTAEGILRIIQAQWSPKDAPRKRKYTLRSKLQRKRLRSQDSETEDSDKDSDSEDNNEDSDLHLESEDEDPEFTKDDLESLVASHETALSILSKTYNFQSLLDVYSRPLTKEAREFLESKPTKATLINLAIVNQDDELFRFVLEQGERLSSSNTPGDRIMKENSPTYFAAGDKDDVQAAFRLGNGRTQMLATLIRKCGTFLPLESLLQSSGIKFADEQNEYKGLRVYGRNRNQTQANGETTSAENLKQPTLLLEAASTGNLDSLEWALSNTPMRCYMEFIESHKDDPKIAALKAKGELEEKLTKWFTARANLVAHLIVMSPAELDRDKKLRFVLDALPKSLNHPSAAGYTPLHIAFLLRRLEPAKILIEAGADQTIRDNMGQSILHQVLCPLNVAPHHLDKLSKATEKVRPFLNLLDGKIAESLWLGRTKSLVQLSSNPVSLWLQRISNSDDAVPMLQLLLEYAPLSAFESISGSGENALHYVVKNDKYILAREMLNRHPQLLLRENVFGATPFDIAQTRALADKLDEPDCIYERDYYACYYVDKKPLCEFKEKPESVDETLETLDLCARMHGEHRDLKRVIVSLLDANEVAKRAPERAEAASKWMRVYTPHYNNSNNSPDQSEDEVGRRLSIAYGSMAAE